MSDIPPPPAGADVVRELWHVRVTYRDTAGVDHTIGEWALSANAARRAAGDAVATLVKYARRDNHGHA